MSQQQATGAFPSTEDIFPSLPVNLRDQAFVGSTWTPGATMAFTLPLSPPMGQTWAVISWTISFVGFIFTGGSAGSPPSGKLGKIIGGVIPALLNIKGTSLPYARPMAPLPQQPQGLLILWDGTSDPAFPMTSGAQPTSAPTVITNSLPIAIQVNAGQQVSIGLWITPSLTNDAAPGIAAAAWAVTYDDGRPGRP